jgi:hypothetical protein
LVHRWAKNIADGGGGYRGSAEESDILVRHYSATSYVSIVL